MVRKIILPAAALAVVVVVGLLWLAPRYAKYRERRSLEAARQYLAAGDLRGAALSCRVVLRSNPRNLGAYETLATVAEAEGSPQALDWRRLVAEISPTVENKLRCAATALQLQGSPYPVATEILHDLAASASNQVAYCNLATDLAIKLQRPKEAERWIERAAWLQPSNEVHRLNLAVLRLGSTNLAQAEHAKAILSRLAADTNLTILALRSLVADSLSRKNPLEAKKFSERLIATRGAQLEDELRHLEILSAEGGRDFEPFLTGLQQRVSTNAAAISEVCSFLVRHHLAEKGRDWLDACPSEIQRAPSISLAMAECLFALRAWPELERFLNRAAWGDFESMRLAFLSQAAFEVRDAAAADLRWQLALGQAHRRLGTFMWLTAKAGEWGRAAARQDTLWEITRQFPRERWAWQELAGVYLAAGDTRHLHEVYHRLASLTPDDIPSRNNFVVTALLLGTNLARAHSEAHKLYSEHPTDAIVCSTYAYSLHTLGRTREGLAVLERVDEEARSSPAIALYYAALLRADGQTAKAGSYFARAREAVLLPEERALLTIP